MRMSFPAATPSDEDKEEARKEAAAWQIAMANEGDEDSAAAPAGQEAGDNEGVVEETGDMS